ncbi:MAG: trypsin-like peptidase domain-containing protein [Phycisphaerales bacterium]|nr:trypsin-like peptidase domain-containing protein [Phycisphaerales bacterium]MCI0631645.1 trypsin-like peptidase domain-containing protein [Phycisphaerales bacterium]
MKKLVIVCMVLATAVAGHAMAQDSALREAEQHLDFREVVQHAKTKVYPAVVYIRCIRESNESGERKSQQVSGSGVIVTPRGHALTNWHVVDKATSIRCLLSDGRAMTATSMGTDKDTDLAVLQLDLKPSDPDLPHAEIGDSSVLQDGDFVMAMGAPYGLNRSVSIGIVSCTRRFLTDISEYSLWLQTDAAINPGNSGGPLVNTAGRIIGINARGMGFAEGMGFAIPSETVSILVPQIVEHGQVNWSWTGLQLQPLRDFNRDMYFDDTEGVIVAETDPESPARKAGIRTRDRIVRVNGQSVTALTDEDLPGVRRLLGLLAKHQEASFEIERNDEMVSVKLTPREKGKVEGDELACKRWDFTVKTINQFDNPDLFFHRQSGVFIYGVKHPGNAGNSGLREQDILLKIDGKEIQTLDDVKSIHAQALKDIEKRNKIVFHVLRGGLMRQVVLDYARDHEKR